MNYKAKLRQTKKQVEDYLVSLEDIEEVKDDSAELVEIRENGENFCLAYCKDCGTVFRCSGYGETQCPHCGREMKNRFITDCQPLRLKGKTDYGSFFVLSVADYDVRTEQITMFVFEGNLRNQRELRTEKAARYMLEQDARLWKSGHTVANACFEHCVWADSHQIQISDCTHGKKSSSMNLDGVETLLTERPWISEILGDPEVLDTLRRHHYPIDDGSEALLRFLAKRADGKKAALSKEEKEQRKRMKEEKERMRQAVLECAFSDSTLKAITQWQRPAVYGFDLTGQVVAQATETGVLLVHVLLWDNNGIKRMDAGDFAARNAVDGLMLTDYLVYALGRHSCQCFDVLAARQGRKAELTAGAFRKRLPDWDRRIDIVPGMYRALKKSNAAWLPIELLDRARWSWPHDTEDRFLWDLLIKTGRYDNETKLLDDLYQKPVLAKLAEAGFPKTLLREHRRLADCVGEQTTIAEMLNVKEDVLPRLRLPECDNEYYLNVWTNLLNSFKNAGMEKLCTLADLLYTGETRPDRWYFPIGMDIDRLIGYLGYLGRLSEKQQYDRYLYLLYCLKMQVLTDEEQFPSDLERADSVVTALYRNMERRWPDSFCLDAARFRTEVFGEIEIIPCWNRYDIFRDLLQVQIEGNRITGQDLDSFPNLPVLRAVQDGKTIGLIQVTASEYRSKGKLSLLFFEKDISSCLPKAVSAFQQYADKYNLVMPAAE